MNKQDTLISIDLETYDPNLSSRGPGGVYKDGEILGISLCAYGREPLFYHKSVWEKDYSKFKDYLTEIFMHPLIGANINYDLEWIHSTFGILPGNTICDVQVAERLLDEHAFSVSLESLSRKYLQQSKNEEPLLIEARRLNIDPKKIKKDMRLIAPDRLRDYALTDSVLPLGIFMKQQALLKTADLWDLFLLECKVLRIALDMRIKGVRFDKERALDNIKELDLELTLASLRLALQNDGEEVNTNAARSLKKLFDRNGLTYPMTEKGNPSFTAAFLDTVQHPVALEVRHYRRTSKLREFLDSFVNEHEYKGRLHPQFHPMKNDLNGTITGRFSSSNPNLQQAPKKGRGKELVRSVFLPEEGEVWVSIDYSQQEPRLMAHFIIDRRLEGWQQIRDAYKNNPDLDFYLFSAEVAGVNRDTGKIIVLATAYGRGLKMTAAALNVSDEQAKQIRDSVFAQIPLQPLSWALQNEASSQGYITTYLKRRCRFPNFEHKDFEKKGKSYKDPIAFMEENPGESFKRADTYKALNSAIQGSAADMVKQAMVNIKDQLGLSPIAQIHDELCYSLPNDFDLDARIIDIKRIMESVFNLHVPIKADVTVGMNWGNTVKWKEAVAV